MSIQIEGGRLGIDPGIVENCGRLMARIKKTVAIYERASSPDSREGEAYDIRHADYRLEEGPDGLSLTVKIRLSERLNPDDLYSGEIHMTLNPYEVQRYLETTLWRIPLRPEGYLALFF